jgi:hypothetical protein
MSADAAPTLAKPSLNHARMEWNDNYPFGFIHMQKKLNGADITTVGYVRGDNLALGYTVEIQRNAKKKYWKGTIISGPNVNENNQIYWSFRVTNINDDPDPGQEETLQVTVTTPSPDNQTSNPVSPDPKPVEIP